MLGRKQALADNQVWTDAMHRAAELVTDTELDDLIGRAVEGIRAEQAAGRVIGYGWSGGKDSQALRYVMDAAGVSDCVLGITAGLEWPAMLRWLTDHMPPACDVIAAPLDLHWLAAHPHMLFPQGADGSKWFGLVQHKAQRDFYVRRQLDLLALGRRRKDGNYIGPKGADRYTNRAGITRWSPIADWTHEQMFALLVRREVPLPPCYGWPRGWQIGTGAWPARQWTTSPDHGWSECWQIDPDVVRHAATVLPQAADWLTRTGNG
ncbi:hypothetical protein [Micromonospora sp. WMMC273]|uniref:hypothetical protein n=1 Tax=Micromonospora sp. WMMC273 TaxID=3015157 RepID=UPI0022B69ED8|nr:hypothetical protein [Micromonospora sp. WMMC273]MCZ7478811.1 hypothetical protein [Micromonospora sp. WMMC273]MCZ7478939.1 hypothetical protein [Micromonospora sp. WMMC273]MCZ7479000.1 hypothetical protein [Micromonospora sp. WMMC273]